MDGKAAVLAGRLDELPARLLVLAPGERIRGAVVALGKLVLLTRAWRARPNDPEIARAVIGAEPREMVIADPATLRSTSSWEVAGERIETRRRARSHRWRTFHDRPFRRWPSSCARSRGARCERSATPRARQGWSGYLAKKRGGFESYYTAA